MSKLDVLFIGSVINYDGTTGSEANYIRRNDRWVTPHQYIFDRRSEVFGHEESRACVYDVPNLSICKLADHLKRHLDDFTSHIVWHFDYHKEEVLDILRNDPPHLVAISTTLAFYPRFLNEAVAWINQHKRPETKVVLGGKWLYEQYKTNGATSELEGVLAATDADYAVINAFGEETLRQLVVAQRAGDLHHAQSLPNLCYRKRDLASAENDNGAVVVPANAESAAFDGEHYRINRHEIETHTPGKPMIDFRNVGRQFLGDVAHVRTCSSCPFRCRFCTFPVLQGEHVLFNLDDVMRQLQQLNEMGVRYLLFVDDTLNVPRDRFERLLDRMIEADLGMQWAGFYRAQFATAEVARKMYDAGCRMVFCGFESGNDKILKLMNKAVTRKQYVRGLDYLDRAGICALASYIVGYPGETEETLQDTLDLINDPRVAFARGSVFYYDPNAPVSELAGEWELTGFGSEWSHKTMTSEEAARHHLEMIKATTSINLPVSDGAGWSVFNLYARGLGLDDIKTLYREFNAIQMQQIEDAGEDAVLGYRPHVKKPPETLKDVARGEPSIPTIDG